MSAEGKKRIKKQIEELADASEKQSVIHVMLSDAGWAVKREGASRAARVYKTKEEALEAALKWVMDSLPGELIVHHPDGTVETRQSFEAPESK